MADSKKEFDIERYYKNLSRAFKGGTPVFRQRIATKIMPPGQTHSPIGTARAFLKSTTNLYASQMASYGMYCIDGDTQIYTPYGAITIKELSEKYSGEETFPVFAYDLEKKKVVCTDAKYPRQTKTDKTLKLTFDDGSEFICTYDHRLLMRDGTYKEAQNIQLNESIMPLYKRDIFKTGYNFLISAGSTGIPEHRLVCEWKEKRQQKENEVVHHINRKKTDNRPENLIFMDKHEHYSMHSREAKSQWLDPVKSEQTKKKLKQSWAENYEERCEIIRNSRTEETCQKLSESTTKFNETYWTEENKEKHSEIMSDVYSDPVALSNMSQSVAKAIKDGNIEVSSNFSNYWKGKKRSEEWKKKASERKYRLRDDLTFDRIASVTKNNNFVKSKTLKELDCASRTLSKKVLEFGFKYWFDFCEHVKQYNNHKIVKIEDAGVRIVYDLEVPGFNNFAIAYNGQPLVFIHNSRLARYSDYAEMESSSIIASALDIYSDEICTKDEHGEMIKIFSHDQKIRKILDSFFYQVLNIDFNLWTWARNFLKYGDQFLLVDHHPNHGILQILPMPVNEVEREEGFDQNDPLAYRYRWTTQGNRTLDPWQVIHFRNGGNDSFMPYGCSVIEPVRRTWRQVVLLEDAVMTYRIVRSPERRVFYIDVGGIDPNDVPVFIEKVKGQLKRNQTVDASTGQLDKRYNPMSILDDYYIPVRGDMTSTRIEPLPGGQYVGDIDDLNYHRDKLFAGLKIPKSYLGYEGEVNARSTLSQEDINFARTIARLQNIVVAELNKMAIIQLWSAGYRGEELMNFDLSMASPSIITEIQRLELWRTRFEVASVAASLEGGFDRKFAYKKLFKLSDEEIEEIEEGRRKDKLFDMELEGIAPPAPPPGEVPPEGEVPPAPEGGLAAGEAPAAQGEQPPGGEQPTPDAEAPITTAGRDPNQQRIMPNPVKGKTKKRKSSNGLPTNLTQVFNFKKTALDPRDGLVQNMRVGSSPFGEESLTMGRMLNEDVGVAAEELSKQELQMRLLRHEGLLNQLESLRWDKIATSPPPVGAPVEPIEDKEKQEKEDEIWDDAQKQSE